MANIKMFQISLVQKFGRIDFLVWEENESKAKSVAGECIGIDEMDNIEVIEITPSLGSVANLSRPLVWKS